MLWQTFLQNVNPLSKVIHTPEVETQVLDASRDISVISKASGALLLSIYTAQYVTATQQALCAAGFMTSSNIVVLQAFVIFLVSSAYVSVYLECRSLCIAFGAPDLRSACLVAFHRNGCTNGSED
jgi:hypothetical protein